MSGGEHTRDVERSLDASAGDPLFAPTAILDATLRLMPDAAIVVDAEGRVTSANRQAEAVFGYAEGALHGLVIEALIPERLRTRHRGHRTAFTSAPSTRSMGAHLQLTGRRLDGHEFPVDVSLAPVDVAGTTFVIAAVRDLTEQQQALSAQIELAALVASSTDAIIATGVEGHIVSWNPAAKELFGYDAPEVVGRHVSMLVPADEQVVLEELLDAAYRSVHSSPRDTRWRARDDRLVNVAVSISPLHFHSETLTGYSFIVRDITERKHIEHELRRLAAEEELLLRQHRATSEIRLRILSNAALDESLSLICERAGELVNAPVATICRQVAGSPVVLAGTGASATMVGTVLSASDSFAGRVIRAGEVLETAHRHDLSAADVSDAMPDGPTLGVPVVMGAVTVASLTFVRDVGSPGYSHIDRMFAENLATQIAIAFEFERARFDRERAMLSGDRERIARDLHDLVVQRLFGVGISLQSALPDVAGEFASERVNDAIDQLDETIREIRNTIFALNVPQSVIAHVRDHVLELAAGATSTLGFEPTVTFTGPVDEALVDRVVPHVLAVVREALSNVARHARASSASVSLRADGSSLDVEVCDDGVGVGDETRSSGLSNLRSRAELLGGSMSMSTPATGGTCLTWRVPIAATSVNL
ncbi:MAG: PAS domain S-box protein [Acidimicrobiales bacterium]